MDYMKMWMQARRKFREIVNEGKAEIIGDYQVYPSDASAVLSLLDQIEIAEYFGEDTE